MEFPRRTFFRLATGAAALPAVSRFVCAQSYPSRPVRIVAGFPAGGGVDITARLIGEWLSERLGQPFIIDNRPGAGGNIGTEAVVKAPADGHTLLLATIPNAVNATLYETLNFNFIRDIAPVGGIIRVPQVILVHPSVPAKTIPEFIAYAKANPEKVNMGSAGSGSAPHLAGALFSFLAGIKMVHVPYRGQGPALADLLSGQVQVFFATTPGMTDFIRSGKLRALAVTTASRAEVLPDLPTVGEFVPGYEASQWYGLGAPKGTPAEIVDKLNKEINAALFDARMKARFAEAPEAVQNTLEVAEKCNLEIEFGKLHYPVFHPPEHFTREGYLRHLLAEGLRTRYGIHARAEGEDFIVERVEDPGRLPTYSGSPATNGESPVTDHQSTITEPGVAAAVQSVIDRLQLELKVIEKTGFLSYFLNIIFIHIFKSFLYQQTSNVAGHYNDRVFEIHYSTFVIR